MKHASEAGKKEKCTLCEQLLPDPAMPHVEECESPDGLFADWCIACKLELHRPA